MLSAKMPAAVQKTAAVVVHVASLALFAVMIVYGCQFAYFVRLQISPALYLPKWIILSIIPLSGAILMVHGLTFLKAEIQSGNRDS
jgi:TRAP-type C4-dicarboxylate transport system permease small subunit